jgi:hypothetical protein
MYFGLKDPYGIGGSVQSCKENSILIFLSSPKIIMLAYADIVFFF